MTRLVLDAGALIALDRNERPMWERMALARRHLTPRVSHGGVVGQVWFTEEVKLLVAQVPATPDLDT